MKIRLGYVAISNALGKKVTSSSNVTYKTYSKITSEEKKIEKMTHLSVAPLFAEAMTRAFTNNSISKLFD